MVAETILSDRSVVSAQLSELRARVDAAEGAVKRVSAVDAALYGRMKGRLADEFRGIREDLAGAEDALWRDDPAADGWQALAAVKGSAEVLLADSLAFVHGALTRANGVDGGLCRVADHLLAVMAGAARLDWRSLTVLDDSEFYESLAQIVRLRFAEASIWGLPIAAHEFGHFAGPAIKVEERQKRRWRYDHPLQQILVEELGTADGKGENKWARMHEYIADVFATYCLGPAYAYTCILLRFNPANPNAEFRHPSDAKRAFAQLETLRRMNVADDNERPYTGMIDDLNDIWCSTVEAAGATIEADPAIALEEARFEAIYDLLEDAAPAARYSSFARVDRLRGELDPQRRDEPRLRAGDTIPDILNAAWQRRLELWDTSAEAIGERAFAACLQIVQRQA